MKSVEVEPAKDRDEQLQFSKTKSKRVRSTMAWVQNMNAAYDIGCVQLDEPLGKKTGYFSIGVFSEDSLRGFGVNIAGYPHGKNGANIVDADHLFHHGNRIQDIREGRIFYDVDTSAGQSGSPVWVHPSSGAAPIVIGIHANGFDEESLNPHERLNSSARIDQQKFEAIRTWIEEMEAPQA